MKTAIARIAVNGIEVGSIPQLTYEEIVKSVRAQRRLYLAYGYNVLKGAWRALVLLLQAIPTFFVAALAVAILFDPDSFSAMFEWARSADAAQVTGSFRSLLIYTATFLTWLLPLIVFLFPGHFAVANPFDRAISRRIRGLLEVPTEGEITVTLHDADTSECG
uniref:hypothetical protein n=1 Tax=Pseudomonas syringae TaxID=317 RepID=UPI001E5E847D|nr:hypothetical protein [Pseudomonas syringae]